MRDDTEPNAAGRQPPSSGASLTLEDLKNQSAVIGRIVKILANQADRAPSDLGVDGYFRGLIDRTNLPEDWRRNRRADVTKHADSTARNLVNWAIGQGRNPSDPQYTVIGSLLEQLLPDAGLEDRLFLWDTCEQHNLVPREVLQRTNPRISKPKESRAESWRRIQPPSKPAWFWPAVVGIMLLALTPLVVWLALRVGGANGTETPLPSPTTAVAMVLESPAPTPIPPAEPTMTHTPKATFTPTTSSPTPTEVPISPTFTQTPTSVTPEIITVTAVPTVTHTSTPLSPTPSSPIPDATATQEPTPEPTSTKLATPTRPSSTELVDKSQNQWVRYSPTSNGDSNWRSLALTWPCRFEGSLPWGTSHNGLWCCRQTLRLSILDEPPIGFGGPSDIWWPSRGTSGFRILSPGMAYEARFIPIEVEDEAAYGIALRDSRNVTYRFLYRVRQEDEVLFFDIQLVEVAPESSPREIRHLSGSDLALDIWNDNTHYRLRVELHRAKLMFKWKGGKASEEWDDLAKVDLSEVGDGYQMGLTIDGFANVVVKELQLEWTSRSAKTPLQPSSIITVDDSDPEYHEHLGSTAFYPMQGLGERNGMRWCTASLENPSYAEWCPNLAQAGNYDVQVYIPREHAGLGLAIYEIGHVGGVAEVPVNQADHEDEWVYLGFYPFKQGREGCVRLTARGEQPWDTGYDAVRWTLQEPDSG